MRHSAEEIERAVRSIVHKKMQELLPLHATSKDGSVEELFNSPAAEELKLEIVSVGRKLWQREYVDGNGGNVSCRLTDELVLCTPTMVSKADIEPAQICLVDLENNFVCGAQPHTSEIRLHLTIYKTVPEARAVVHCHPPHATAYAITGLTPPVGILPEYEVFVGPIPITPYETPGTQAFADTVLPYARSHNTLLLANHGVVTWADTPTHAEWCVEVLDTYCRTLILAAQLGRPITRIPENMIADLLRIKQSLGLPDPRNVTFGQENGAAEPPVPPTLAENLANEVLRKLKEQ